jgi:divalent metal cation (Fe/Co/Zn/Cd) transporter
VLWEGAGVIALVGTVLTASPFTEAVAALLVALLVLHSPGHMENRTE